MRYRSIRRLLLLGCCTVLLLMAFASVSIVVANASASEELGYTPADQLVEKGAKNIVFRDRNLVTYMRENHGGLQNKDGSYPLSKLKKIDFISIWCRSAFDLSELQFFTNLGGLCIYDAPEVVGMAALTHCAKLDYLSLDNILEMDVMALVQATPGIEMVTFDDCGMLDYGSITEWKKLDSVTLGGGNIIDLSYLAEIPSLDWLSFSNAPEADFSTCQGIAGLKTLLFFENSMLLQPEIWTMIGNNPNLETLTLGSEWISGTYDFDETVFGQLQNLTALEISGAAIASLDFLANCPNLQTLAFDHCTFGVSDFAEIGRLKELQELALCDAGVTEINFVDGMSLHLLWLNGNQIDDISPLTKVKKLKKLALCGNPVEDLEPLKKIKGLKYFQYDGKANTPKIKGVEIEKSRGERLFHTQSWEQLLK